MQFLPQPHTHLLWINSIREKKALNNFVCAIREKRVFNIHWNVRCRRKITRRLNLAIEAECSAIDSKMSKAWIIFFLFIYFNKHQSLILNEMRLLHLHYFSKSIAHNRTNFLIIFQWTKNSKFLLFLPFFSINP